ncbi:hypothetical protein AnigIFM63604_001094 [Aspergillus niger]|uniref:NWD NACHT-NTPase N-terminal domain-containing protein n=1 Tax=Aspergillus niger TaxID=5061 RepID=A0A9W6ABL0_ASPNG|nr:hypothetical protein AnigIFM63604_001094 [Aspergillus niger]
MSHDKVDPRGIWRRAYELLKEENEALVHDYEEKIQSAKDQIKLKGKEKLSPGIYPDEVHGMLSLTNEMIQQEEHKQTWNQSVTMAVQIVTSMKDIVAQAIKNSPEASLAWAGLCLILPVSPNFVLAIIHLTRDLRRSENVEGLSKVIHRISYYPSYAVWLMNHHSPGPDETWKVLEGQIVLLYKMLIQYIAKSVCQYYHVDSATNKVKQLLKDTLKWGSWTTMIDDMQRLELEIQGKAQDLNLIASRNLLQTLNEASQQQLELNNHMEQYLRETRDALALTLSSPGCQASGVKEIYTQRGPLVPFLRDKESFVGREVCFQQINEGFEQSTRIALCGLGGAGKSRIALEYVYQMREQDPHLCIFWVFAASRSSLQSSYETIRREIPPEYIRTLQFSLRTGVAGNVDTERETISLVTQWLRSDQISRWLLVVDNADDLTFVDPTQPEESHLMNLIPSASNGKVLITSRNGRVAEELVGFANRVVRVERMTMTEATTLFRSMLPNDTSPEADIEKLADAIMCLPLAIKQACAYIRATYTTVSEYLVLFMANEMNQKSLLEENFGDITRRADVPNAVILTWQMSFEKMKQQVPVTDASEILAFMAMVSREEIPGFILACRWKKGDIALQRDIGLLLSYSLITRMPQKNNHFNMHRLIQLTVRAWLEKRGDLDHFEAAALEVIHNLFRKALSEEDWPQCRLLYRHAQAVSQYKYSEERYHRMNEALLHDIYTYSHPSPAQMDPCQDLEGKIPIQLLGSQPAILQSCEFIEWMRGEERGLLLVGPPGTGKTSVCTFLIASYLPRHVNAETLYFLFSYAMTGDDQMSQSVLLKLLGQLCRVYVEGSRIPDKVREIWSQCKDPSTKRVNVDELLSILVHVADDLDREVIVIFDGIDEVQSTANLDGIFRMIDSLLNHRRFRLLVSSRAVGYMEERQWPQRMLKIELSLETFTVIGWTTAIPHMIQQVGFDQIITIINKDPAGSTSWMYDAVFASMRIGQRRYVERIFCWLAYSLRSLTSGEVLEAINSDFNTSFDESELTAMCHPLAVPAFNGETRVIQFMHKRVESHVLQLHTSTATGEADANWIIISSCLRCILRYGPEVAIETINELPSQFLMYAAKYWPKHLQSCISPSVAVKGTDIPDEARDYMRQLFDLNSSQAFLGWLRLFDPMNPTRGSQLEAALDDFPPQAAYIAELGLPPEILLLTPNKTMPAAQPIMPIRRRKGWKEKAGAFWARRHFLTD